MFFACLIINCSNLLVKTPPTEITLEVIQESNYFGVYDAVDNIIALGWEKLEDDFEGMENIKRLSFHYGESRKSVEDKLYSRDIVLNNINEIKLDINN